MASKCAYDVFKGWRKCPEGAALWAALSMAKMALNANRTGATIMAHRQAVRAWDNHANQCSGVTMYPAAWINANDMEVSK